MTLPQSLLKAWDLKAQKNLGQNFLIDPSTAEMILNRADIHKDNTETIIEIGAGLGALTIPAAKRAKWLYAIEKDRRLIPLLEREIVQAGLKNITIQQSDILRTDLDLFLSEGENNIIIGNLPYNISSQILIKILPLREKLKKGVFMLQAEMAERIKARPSTKDYGRLSLVMQYCGDVEIISEVKSHLFYPKPKVDSAIIEVVFKKKEEIRADNEEFFFKTVKAAFSQRRKTIKNSLSAGMRMDGSETEKMLKEAGIEPQRRAETLDLQEFVHLSNTAFRIISEKQAILIKL